MWSEVSILGTLKRKTTTTSSSLPIASACEEQLPSPHLLSFQKFPMIASAHTHLPILFPPLIGDYFTTFFPLCENHLFILCAQQLISLVLIQALFSSWEHPFQFQS